MKISDDILRDALNQYNDEMLKSIPDIIDIHVFSKGFERKIKILNNAYKNFDGHLIVERVTSYIIKAAAVVLCCIVINIISVKAFDFNIWNTVFTKTSEFISVHFIKNTEDSNYENSDVRLRIKEVSKKYEKSEEYFSKELTVQNFRGERGTITYSEGPVTETAQINMAVGDGEKVFIEAREIFLYKNKDNVTAFFSDSKYYHIVEVQGEDADKDFVIEIIKNLEEQ